MPKLARTIRFDESDDNVFSRAAEAGEWAISGGFAFSNFTEADLAGKARQAFSNGWLSLDSFGRATFVAVAQAEETEVEALTAQLAEHFVEVYGAPSADAALSVASEEIQHMRDLCEEHADNTLLAVSRALTEAGVRETYRAIETPDAEIEMVAVHATPEG